MPEYKFDPDRPGITPELFEQHHRNRARMEAALKAKPVALSMAERGARGKERERAWHDDVRFLVADHIAEYFTRPGNDGLEPGYDNYPFKARLHAKIAKGFVKRDKRGREQINKGKKSADMPAGTIKKMVDRYRKKFPAQFDALIQERISIRRATYIEAKEAERQRKGPQMPQRFPPNDPSIADRATELLFRLADKSK